MIISVIKKKKKKIQGHNRTVVCGLQFMAFLRSCMVSGLTLSAAHFSNRCCGRRNGSGFRTDESSDSEARNWVSSASCSSTLAPTSRSNLAFSSLKQGIGFNNMKLLRLSFASRKKSEICIMAYQFISCFIKWLIFSMNCLYLSVQTTQISLHFIVGVLYFTFYI